MPEKYEIDSIDKEILSILQDDCRTPYLEIARKLIVSGGTIHQRVEKLRKMGIIQNNTININFQKLGFDVSAFLGIHLKSTRDLGQVISELKKMPEVVEANYTTGSYALLIKVQTKSIQDFHTFLSNKLQAIDAIQSTESFISLDRPINRNITL